MAREDEPVPYPPPAPRTELEVEMLALLRRWAVPIGTWDDMDDLQGKTEELLVRIDRKEAPR